jgi:RsiW-degrading membrane proteinase PrsW (M82 family)
MAQQSNDIRERLLATLPAPENLAAYREETASLLAKHSRALRWDKVMAYLFVSLATALWFLWTPNQPWHLRAGVIHGFQVASALMFFYGVIYVARYEIYASQVATLKEIKQVQLQILELQALLRKER